ncbi:hypothetical protein QSH57_009698 [Fusarium oxysporum f. sp. vasinfectum]|nr:hypothetical protein QSH57_009698 [Fusarium oxysporum f. sp. vasinfectum]
MASSLSSYVFDDEGMTWITCDLCAGSFQRGSGLCQACHGTKLRRVSYSYLATGSSLPRFKEAPLLHHLLRPEVASMAVLTEAQVASVSMVVVLDHFTSWRTMVSLAKKCLSGHV